MRTAAQPQHTNQDITVKNSQKHADSPVSGDNFLLKGNTFNNKRCISNNSGEAQVYLVENQGQEYVLKIYYPNYKMNREIMKIVANMHFEMVMKIYDYGSTYVEGKKRDYELMEYLKGGTISQYGTEHDINRFRRIALQCAAALEYIHKKGIIHKDIKPGNFFFRDEQKTQVVLGDFGISSAYDDQTMVTKTTQARTPAFAAPDMYTNVIDGEVEITPATDYYSLGMTLLVLWLGKSAIDNNERHMMRMKMEGQLPHIDELPQQVRTLIQGLTTVNPMKRWGYNEVERWFKGEEVEVDLSSPFLRYNSFVVDPEKNLVAQNPKQLATMFMRNQDLAVSYLYSGKVEDWLTRSGSDKMAIKIKEYITDTYPAAPKTGLMASLYTLDPEMPYTDVKGKSCTSLHALCLSLVSNMEEYGMLLKNPNDGVYVYLQTHSDCDVDRLRNYFAPGSGLDTRTAIQRMVYEFDPDVPFLAKHPSSTLDEIVRAFGYENISEDEWKSVCDGRLLSWMYRHSDQLLCETVKIMTEGQPYSKGLSYKVLYNIDRESAYDLRDADTPEEVAELMNQKLMECQHLSGEEFAKEMDDFVNPSGRLFYYAQMHGWYDVMSQGKSIFNMQSTENRERMGAYDLPTAAYRFCRVMGGHPTYKVSADLIAESDGDLDRKHLADIKSELRSGNLAQWLTLFYHENPDEAFEEAYSYERAVEKWLMRLGDFDPSQKYYKRYVAAKEETEKMKEEAKAMWRNATGKEVKWAFIFYGLCAIWLLMVLLLGFSDTGKEYLTEHPVFSITLPLGTCLGLICATHGYFRGYGTMLCLLAFIAGVASTVIPIFILKAVYASMPALFTPAVLVISLGYIALAYFTRYKRNAGDAKNAINDALDDDIRSELLEPLYYAFKMKTYSFKGTKFAAIQDVSNHVSSMSGESVAHYICWAVLAAVMVGDFVLFSPKVFNMKTPDLIELNLTYQGIMHTLKKSIE